MDTSGPVPVIREAAIALGGVAHKPWRARRAEELLRGAEATRETFRRAADAELEDAAVLDGNAFKVPMARGAFVTVLAELTGIELTGAELTGAELTGAGLIGAEETGTERIAIEGTDIGGAGANGTTSTEENGHE